MELEVQNEGIKRKKSVLMVLIATILIISMNYAVPFIGNANGSSITSFAADSASTAFENVQNSSGGVIGNGVKSKVNGLSADAQSITLSAVMGILIISTLVTSLKFSGAGDSPQKKSVLKSALIFQVLGIAFVASYSGLIAFGLRNLNMFD